MFSVAAQFIAPEAPQRNKLRCHNELGSYGKQMAFTLTHT